MAYLDATEPTVQGRRLDEATVAASEGGVVVATCHRVELYLPASADRHTARP